MAESNEGSEEIKQLREELREIKVTERKNFREMFFQRKRMKLGETHLWDETECCTAIFSTEDVTNLGKELKKKSLNLKKYKNLQNALIQNEENINTFLAIDNIIHSLVRDLSGNNPHVQIAAAYCCCNIALGNEKACMALAKSCIPYLITELDSMNYHLTIICIWTIGNLVVGNPKIMDILMAQDFIQHLITLVNHCNEEVRSAVIYTCVRCFYIGRHVIPENEMINLTMEIKKKSNNLISLDDIWLFVLLSSNRECVKRLRDYAPICVERLYKNLWNEFNDLDEITALLRLLGNLASEFANQVAELLMDNSSFRVESLLDKLLLHRFLRSETFWLIGNIYNYTEENSEYRIRIQDALTRLKNLC